MKPMKSFRLTNLPLAAIGLFSLVLSCAVYAQTPANNKAASSQVRPSDQGRGQTQRPHREPPPQAYEKCKAKKE